MCPPRWPCCPEPGPRQAPGRPQAVGMAFLHQKYMRPPDMALLHCARPQAGGIITPSEVHAPTRHGSVVLLNAPASRQPGLSQALARASEVHAPSRHGPVVLVVKLPGALLLEDGGNVAPHLGQPAQVVAGVARVSGGGGCRGRWWLRVATGGCGGGGGGHSPTRHGSLEGCAAESAMMQCVVQCTRPGGHLLLGLYTVSDGSTVTSTRSSRCVQQLTSMCRRDTGARLHGGADAQLPARSFLPW